MIPALSSADVERFRGVIARCLGLQFDDAKSGLLVDVLGSRLAATRLSPDAYLASVETACPGNEIGALAQALTVPETHFFRNKDQYRALTEIALPDRMREQAAFKRLRILSAGCASGEEAYSLAVLVREALDTSWDVSILGVDLNPVMVSKATQGRYSAWALRETTADIQERWFKPEGRDFVLADTLRAAVRFEERNLVTDDPHLWQPESYDVVFFRNVLMYFTPENQQNVIGRIARSLMPGGYLFLGHAETLRGLSDDFHLRHTHATFYYQRRDRLESSARPAAAALLSQGLVPDAVAAVEGADTWIDAIRQATERVENRAGSARQRPNPLPRATTSAWDLELARKLLREERFTEALEMMQLLPAEAGRDPDVLLLSAALLTHRGRLAEAQEACRRLLDVDELSAGANYLLALCREGVSDRASAVYHDQVAIYLDPSFAMPHLHLGLLARRAGDRATAQRELEEALLLLQREEGSRLLLFGGGFGRDTLVALCRAELVGCAGKPRASARLA